MASADNGHFLSKEASVRLTGHQIGLLKQYMCDLVQQAQQDEQAQSLFGFDPGPYRPDQAISDLLAILDDRIESEGVEVGLAQGFLHQMWMLCNDAQGYVKDRVWIETNVGDRSVSRAATRELTYRALLTFIEGKEIAENERDSREGEIGEP